MRVKNYKAFVENFIILFLGATTSFSLPPYNYWLLNFLTFSLLFIILFINKLKNPKIFFLYGYIFGFGYFISSLYWIPLSLVYDENFKFLIPIAIIIIPGFLSLFFALAFLIFKIFFDQNRIFANILIFSLVLGFMEYLRGMILSGFPWNLFAFSFSANLEFLQINSQIGVYAFNTFLITIFVLPAMFFLKNKKIDFYGLVFVLALILSNYIYGYVKLQNFKNLKAEDLTSEIKILSTNIPISRFYSNSDDEQILIKLINLSNPTPDEKILFIWPEGIIPNTNLKSLKNEYEYLFEQSFSKNHKIILGVNDDEKKNEERIFYNTFSVIDNKVNVVFKYNKNKLVPFGEFLPLEIILSKFGLKSLTNNYQSYSSGTERNLFNDIDNSKIKILPLICYEIIYSGQLSEDNNYDFIVNLSEDGWFGDSIGPHQHFAHTIFRSIEYGKYTLRSANNGISAVVDPSGSIIDKININNEGAISIKKMTNVDKTPFSIYGNKIYFLIILLYIFLIFSFKKLKNE